MNSSFPARRCLARCINSRRHARSQRKWEKLLRSHSRSQHVTRTNPLRQAFEGGSAPALNDC